MKKMLAILLCAVLILPLFGCGKATGNTLWEEGSPETSAMFLYSFNTDGGEARITFNQKDEQAILDRLSAVKATPVADWTADKVKLPVYGIEIGTKDGLGVLAAWSNGYLILRDGSVYDFDFDFSTLATDYQWESSHEVHSLSGMPCGRLLSEGSSGWTTSHLTPAKPLTSPEGISMTRKEQSADKITVELTNNTGTDWCYGEYFSLQVLLNDTWYDVPVLDDKNYAFADIGIILPDGENREKTYNLAMYGSLPEGSYRLVVEGLSAEFDLPYTEKSIRSITVETENRAFAAVMECFWADEENRYLFGAPISPYVIVHYADGSEETITSALWAGRVTIDDLDAFGIDYFTEPKA